MKYKPIFNFTIQRILMYRGQKFIDVFSDSIWHVNLKKLSLAEMWFRIKNTYSQLSERLMKYLSLFQLDIL